MPLGALRQMFHSLAHEKTPLDQIPKVQNVKNSFPETQSVDIGAAGCMFCGEGSAGGDFVRLGRKRPDEDEGKDAHFHTRHERRGSNRDI